MKNSTDVSWNFLSFSDIYKHLALLKRQDMKKKIETSNFWLCM